MELFLQILSVAGQVLLIILITAAVLTALILFLPVAYEFKIKKSGKLDASGDIRWLFGAVRLSFFPGRGAAVWSLRLFNIPVLTSAGSSKKRAGAKNRGYSTAMKRPAGRPGERRDGEKRSRTVTAESRNREGFTQNIKKDADLSGADERTFAQKIRFTFDKLCDRLKRVKEFKALLDEVLPILKKLLGAILPKKVHGYIDFGFDDPAHTGIFLAVISMLSVPIPKGLKVTPDFSQKKFECDLAIKGRIFIIVLLVNIFKLFRIQEVRKLLSGTFPSKKNKVHKKQREKNRRR